LSILTKICIVLLVVVALLVTPIFIAQATVPANYRIAYERELQQKKAALQTSRQYQIAAVNARDQLTRIQKASSADKAELQREKAKLQRELDAKELRVAGLTGKLDQVQQSLEKLQIAYNKEIEYRDSIVSQLKECREDADDLRAQNRQLSNSLRQEQSQVARLKKALDLQEEIVAEKNREIEKLNEKITEYQRTGAVASREDGESEVTAPSNISGTVTAVRDNLASINIGSAQGVKEGMKLMIYRGDNFVSYLRIEEVRVDQAVGTIAGQQLQPMQDDKVASPSALE
jgi:chromosome segregation ATPase